MDGRCGTCRHWATIDLDDPWERKPALYDENGERVRDAEYEDVPAPGRWGWCQRVAEFGPDKASRFYVVDGSEYMAKLGTREDFGCVEHEPSEENH